MNIVIVGGGVVGSNLAEDLSSTGHQVSIVDRDPNIIRRCSERMDVLGIEGSGGSPSVLKRAGIADAEMVIAVTSVDEVNLVICMLANQFGVKHKIARIRNEEYSGPDAAFDAKAIGIDSIISPEGVIVEELLNVLAIPGSSDVATFAEGKVLLVTFVVEADAPLAGKRLMELREASSMAAFLVVALIRDEQTIIPKGDDRIEAGDHIAVMVNADTLPLVLPIISRRVAPCRRVIISGADIIGLRLARELEQRMERVVLIERDAQLAEEAARKLPNTLVLHGEATEPEILREADAERCDFFMALSRDDEYNLLSSLMARRSKVARVACLSISPSYVPVLTSIGLDVVVNPRLVTVGEILRYVRNGPVHTVTRLKESDAEVIEMEVVAKSRALTRPLKELNFPAGAILSAVIRDDEMHIPGGNFKLNQGDVVIVFCLPEAIPKIEKLFSKRRFLL